ncbi:hypothetical protein NE235_33050 [Actinoallomurus spadix]|uniref:Uncharacterized protein n=1 Tax=Actinoallomurus spadix TaxID=79912 RepID=A0ABN0WR00_9ACTN|nr:hypothetical protein [Actinoallomurus spadix]MCO5990950.1 hypothetical protein [Actinoallomurus spadix]
MRSKVIRARDVPAGFGDMDASLYLLRRLRRSAHGGAGILRSFARGQAEVLAGLLSAIPAILRARDAYDYSFTDWIYRPTALTPEEEPPMFSPIPLDSAGVPLDSARVPGPAGGPETSPVPAGRSTGA